MRRDELSRKVCGWLARGGIAAMALTFGNQKVKMRTHREDWLTMNRSYINPAQSHQVKYLAAYSMRREHYDNPNLLRQEWM